MTYLLPSRFSAILLLGLGLLLPGCCANNVCDCPGEAQADAIKLVFSAKDFSKVADLDTIVLQRYPLVIIPASGSNPGTKPETVTLTRSAAQAYDTIVINNSTPFAQTSTTKLDQYQYYVRYFPAPRKARPAFALVIDKVALQGNLDGNGCCTCYTNTQKSITTRKDSTASTNTALITNLKGVPVFTITK
ncbi:hypothetical protein [Hymenobacter negativus]|uniref:Lipoprotein n=1 Tax=Hymenobacter negativus TaxID=2795026 RepID=A0ABS0QD13_9BACT|nr:hypothetical protein [Hymenobacter negativus]MBH8560520.1 hypothetical protein [Hymenobacter negativus]